MLGILVCTCAAQTGICASGQGTACVTTWHNDNGRTGQNLNEIKLTPGTGGSVATNNFGQLCSAQLDGQVWAQPLVLTGVPWGTLGNLTVVYVVTMNDTLYAINGAGNGASCQILATLPFLNTAGLPTNGHQAVNCDQIANQRCTAINPYLGVLGTPVIQVNPNGTSAKMYLVTYSYNPANQEFYHYLYAVDVSSSNIQATDWVQICSTLPNGKCGNQSPSIFSLNHIQRPGLLYLTKTQQPNLSSDMVYIAFGMMDDTNYPWPNGWILGYNASNLKQTSPAPLQFSTSQGGIAGSEGGGFWMGAGGPTWGLDKASGSGYIYVASANGSWDSSSNWGDSFLKLDPTTLAIQKDNNNNPIGYFTPSDLAFRDCGASTWAPAA